MTPPGIPVAGENAGSAGNPAVGVSVSVIKKRADFLRAARASRQATLGFVLQARKRKSDETPHTDIRIGFTCSKKVGNAVARNRAKRRLRAAAQVVLGRSGVAGWDYVLIGRAQMTVTVPMATLVEDLQTALTIIHQEPR